MSTASVVDIAPSDAYAESADIRRYLSILLKRRNTFIQVFVLIVGIGVAATIMSRPIYQTETQVKVPAVPATLRLEDSNNPLSSLLSGVQPDPVTTVIQEIQSSGFIGKAEDHIHYQRKRGIVPPNVRVEEVKDTNVIRIVVTAGDKDLAKNLADALIWWLQTETHDRRTAGLKQALKFVGDQLAQTKDALAAANRRIQRYRYTAWIPQSAEEQAEVLRTFDDLRKNQIDAQSAYGSAVQQLATLRAQIAAEPPDIAQKHYVENPNRAPIEQRLRDLQAQRRDALQKYVEGSDVVRGIDEQIKAETTALSHEPRYLQQQTYLPNQRREALQLSAAQLQGQLPGLRESKTLAEQNFAQAEARIRELGVKQVTLNDMIGEQGRIQARFNFLSDRQQDLQIRTQGEEFVQMANVIQAAGTPSHPVSPKPLLNFAVTAILAILLAGGAAFLEEYLDDRITDPEDIQRVTGLPSLGQVPVLEPDQRLLVGDLPANSHAAESYRALRSSIGFAALDAPIRRLQVTSCSKGEGKTVTSVNLATALAMDGRKVILVDSDLRRPSVHRVLNLPNGPGLTDVLVGNLTAEQALQNSPLPDLRVLTAGPIPPNPAELLGSRAFDRVIAQLEEAADIVIFDSPPCLPVTDPVVVAARMDGVIMVVSVGNTRRGALKHVMEQLNRARARVLGVVLNRLEAKKGGYYYYYYYYQADGYYSDGNGSGRRGRRRGGHSKTPVGSGAQSRSNSLGEGSDEE